MRIALIGFGEVGQAAAQALRGSGARDLCAWDLKFADPDAFPTAAVMSGGVAIGTSAEEAVKGAALILSAVTAAQCLAAAQAAAAGIAPGALYLDVNSASPAAKIAASKAIEAAGGRYVEAAVMSPIEPRRLGSPMLLGGPHAQAFLDETAELGFNGAEVYSPEIGKAAATKLCRSVMIKGFEALVAESLLSARRYGVEDVVLSSLANLLPMPDWPERARYMISRSLEHGARRAEEMREAALTVAEAGIEPLMSRAIAARQDWAAGHRDAFDAKTLTEMLDAILRDLPEEPPR